MSSLPFLADHGGRSTNELLALEGHYHIDSLVVAFEAALLNKTQFTEPERVVLAIEAVEREVNNGGFNQFFFNSSREHAYFAPLALRAIGAPQTAELVEGAIYAISGGQVLDTNELRARAVNAELDRAYYQGKEEPLADKLFEYIKRNRASITTNAP